VFWNKKTVCKSWLQKSNCFQLEKSFIQILQKWKNIFIKRFTTYLCAIFVSGARHDLTHNISKNQLQRIYRILDIADLGFSHLYFSSKNKQELA
jgi:hypothetical protein